MENDDLGVNQITLKKDKFLHVLLFSIAFDFDEVPLLELRLVAIVSYASNVAKRPSKNWYVFSKILKKRSESKY